MCIDVEASKFADFMECIVEGLIAVVDTIVVAGIEFADEDEDCQDYHKNGHVLVKAWDGQCVHFKIEYFPKDSIINAMDSPDTSSLWIPSLAAPRHLLHHGPH